MTLHEDEIPVDETLVRSLLRAQCPQWADLPLSRAGAGTDNTMYRLGEDLLVRLPRTPGGGRSLRKEQEWLPRLAPLLPCPVPEPVHAGTPTGDFPVVWSVLRWIDGEEPGPDTVRDWAAFGADLAAFVRELHGADLMGATRSGGLDWYRGGPLAPCDRWVGESFDECRALVGDELDVDALERLWRDALALPGPPGPRGWLHGDLRPGNLLVREGRLCAVIDFGGLSVGFPDAEHAPVWDLPPRARSAYRDALDLDEETWARARAWAIAVGVSGIPYYRDTLPAFAAECRARLRAVLADADAR
ncbi:MULTISPECIES: aminoglycoside phosphotransferase family protein [Streptomyces]|uniref:Aminoglycoside phosphotransferase family protein n=1 Tax=Streptomyces sudanensis TaxID=436397 RepID=A0ABY4TAU1_9ACTN|nr:MULTISPECIES: aminoglycoside phosphotransferase family protein [Streptomyces]MCP9957829.1 aminoglycoside phosphotransferase family protein [Streptomyces sudanensis]MCP9986959.1 aminoglycoside phosphotransferase family protein [Streptomyces sudanensis]MCQ0001631.1 aminoglycoside phosphotransferase family protein [Streptomyces sudanensis]URN15521.1 aminoglycoside phosphotransferase family protein [Streptomyces sudanensis]